MAKKNKSRKPRTKEINKVDLLVPVDITKLSTDGDCFGQLNDPKAAECGRCGDCELCQIVMAQNMHLTRDKIEKKQKFRDIEEEEIYKSIDLKLKKSIRATIRKHKTISQESLIEDVAVQHNVTEGKVKRILKSLLKTTNKFKLTKNKLIWNQDE